MSEPYIHVCQHVGVGKEERVCPHAGNARCRCCFDCRNDCAGHALVIKFGGAPISEIEKRSYRAQELLRPGSQIKRTSTGNLVLM